MKAVVQVTSGASVSSEQEVLGEIKKGLVVLLGIQRNDKESDLNYMVQKICNLRCFSDEQGKFQHSLIDTQGSLLLISQFTLLGNCQKGRRPSFSKSEEPIAAEKMYQKSIEKFRSHGINVETGCFGAAMEVTLTNQGPVTFIIDSREAAPNL